MTQRPSSYRRRPGDVILRRARLETETVRARSPRRIRISPKLWMVPAIFAAIMLGGGALLHLPFASSTGERLPFFDTLFTAVSAVSVTGLTRFDTADSYSGWGELITLALFQIGGLGVTMYAGLVILIVGQRFGMRGRQFLGIELIGSGTERSGAPQLLRRVMLYTFAVEFTTFALLLPWFLIDQPGEIGMARAAWVALYSAVSAFNNAGFDLMGGGNSFIGQAHSAWPVMVMGMSALLGSLSFLTVFDLRRGRRRWALDTKIVLTGMSLLLVLGMALFLASEWNALLGQQSLGSRVANSFFLSVNRTTGMTTVPIDEANQTSSVAMLILMFIGGASTSTASGIKIGAFMVVCFGVFSALLGRPRVIAFGREIPEQVVLRANALVFIALGGYAIGLVLFLAVEPEHHVLAAAFDVMSALANVGWTQNIAASASTAGANILIVMMFVGRLGPLVITGLIPDRPRERFRYPTAEVRIG